MSADLAIVRDGEKTVLATGPSAVIRANGSEAFEALQGLKDGWWAGFIAYDLGRTVERVPDLATDDLHLPDLYLVRFDERRPLEPGETIPGEDASPKLGPWRSSLDRPAFERAVGRIAEHLREGDCYQVNLTRRLETATEAEPLSLYTALQEGNPAPHAALLRFEDVSVVSASPERFIRRDGKRIETRPIKGTNADRRALETSAKDRAENVMIVDLARNDLGRLCEYGTVHVPALCETEAHPGLFHLVSTVVGTLRSDVTAGDIIRATFPPASVTGCPKPRVLEIIEQLEPVRRGVYCGAIGFIDADNDVIDLNVAIRTFTMTEGSTYFGVGGGIVADSDAADEWGETELKARRLLELAGA